VKFFYITLIQKLTMYSITFNIWLMSTKKIEYTLSRANVFCTPGSLIQTSIDEIAGCSRRGEICQVCPNVPIYSLNRKVLWEFVGNGSMSSQLTEPRGGDVLELQSRYNDNNLMPWWVNLDQIKPEHKCTHGWPGSVPVGLQPYKIHTWICTSQEILVTWICGSSICKMTSTCNGSGSHEYL